MQIEAERVGYAVWNGAQGVFDDQEWSTTEKDAMEKFLRRYPGCSNVLFLPGNTHKVVPVYIEKGK